MSSISAQGVVERASAELSKRINGLGLRSSKHHRSSSSSAATNNGETGSHGGGNTKTSVMERVTNVFCGGSNSNSVASSGGSVGAPEKPSRLHSGRSSKAASSAVNGNSVLVTPQVTRRVPTSVVNQNTATTTSSSVSLPQYLTWDQLMLDERFLSKFFLYFTPGERRTLAQVCGKWRDVLYRTPRYWAGLTPVLKCRELRAAPCPERARLYSSLLRRGFHAVSLLGATDEDALDLVHSFPLAAKHVHSLSLQCSSVSDRGLEALLDHLQALFELELAGCNEITEAGLWACLTPRIVSLTLTDCINVADEAVGAVAQLLPSLYEFSLQAYHVTDAALGYFSPKQSNSLSILRLQSCWELTNHGIVNIVHSLPNLTILSLSGCSKITDDGVELIAENLQKLRSLDLSWCPRITDASLEYIACDLNQLEELTLDRCVHITDIGVGYISTMLSLSALFLRWCSQVRDFGLQHLCGMRNLQVLSLAGCPLLTSSGLSSLIQLRHLQELELTNCPGVSRELFEYIREHLPRCLVIE
ncbi:F-box/LRR-repeat protein 16 isoform X1 [Zootermopsis nevadensis]|uniref:F-box/LRR-repeat protein 16 isoform X1 n=1 Tax=Zootermopsis nevadensis TaxID=136037 RepID=UPI000B8EE03A|nr:F-box/LRR-repeat protein 16 isoform X1 [Zootermopsis nevadensis]